MAIARIVLLPASALILLSAASCQNGTVVASDTIKQCAANDLVKSSDILYTGPVGAGPGSRWIVLSDGPITLAADVNDIFGRVPPEIFAQVPTAAVNCSLSKTQKVDLGVDLGVSVATLPVSADLKGKLANASSVQTSVDGFEWHMIKLDVYNGLIAGLPDASPYKKPAPGRMTAVSMLRVKGYVATVEIGRDADLGLGAGYVGPLPAGVVGDVKGKVTASVTKEGKLVIAVPGEAYIAGIFRPVSGATGTTESASASTEQAGKTWQVRAVDVNNRNL